MNYDGQILFTNLDLWTDKDKKYIEKSNIFIKEILDEKSEIIENSAWYYQSKDELKQASVEELTKRCIDIINDSNTKEMRLEPVEFGSLVRGQAYSKDFNQFYEVIGFIVDNNIYIDNQLKAKQKGFFSVYHSNCDNVPLIFERNYSDEDNSFNGKHFVAGNNDRVDIVETLINKEVIDYSINNKLSKEKEYLTMSK